MGKMKAVAAEREASNSDPRPPALVVFGRDEGGRPHASMFTAAEAELATRAAGYMSMQVLPITTGDHRAAASELPAGRIFASGMAFVPFCKEVAHERLQSFPEAFQPEPPVEPAAPTYTGVPATWGDIALGSLVAASDGSTKGLYEAIVVGAPGDDLFQLQWRDWPGLPPVVRRREHIALLTKELAAVAEQLTEVLADAVEAASAEA